jgi:2-(1,2-epoxy-1,2-dihydrophenyl)acetyl-CoA isomerase
MMESSIDGQMVVRVEPTGVVWFVLNRPDAGNAIAPAQRNRLIELVEEASGDPSVRSVVITGAGDRHFCTGGDLRDDGAAPPAQGTSLAVGELTRVIQTGVQRLMAAVMDCDKPVIAAVNGTAAGIGCHLAFACDLVVAADDARFIEIFVRRGLVVDGAGAYLLTRMLGTHRTKELLFFGDDLPAAEAERLGLVNRAVPRSEVATVAGQWAERLAGGPTVSMALTKHLVNRAVDQDRAAAFHDEAVACELNAGSEDFREGMQSFLERRPAAFTGH